MSAEAPCFEPRPTELSGATELGADVSGRWRKGMEQGNWTQCVRAPRTRFDARYRATLA